MTKEALKAAGEITEKPKEIVERRAKALATTQPKELAERREARRGRKYNR